jgi:hypothetical protein
MRGGRHLAGSVSHYCISHASCPVVAVPEQLSELQHDLPEECTRHHDLAIAGGELDDATAAISGPLTARHRPWEGRPVVVDRSAAAAQPIQLGPAPPLPRHHADPGNITAIRKEER